MGLLAEKVSRLGGVDEAAPEGPDVDNLVHDLRGPLSVIVAFAESLDGAPREEQARFVERLVANAHRALAVLEEFAALCDLRNGEIETDPRPMDLAEVARQAVEATSEGSRRGVEISFLASQDGVAMMGDRDLLGMALRAVLRCLAQEFAGRSPLRLQVSGDGDFVALEARILQAGRRHGQRVRASGGEFEILQRVVALHGGRVLFDQDDAASLFRVSIPRQPR